MSWTKVTLGLIIGLGLCLRVINLSNVPPALSWDEVSHGYNAYSILKTGQDEWGQTPLTNFRAYGDYPTTLDMYLTVPLEAIWGLQDWVIRLPTAILGTGIILVVYLLSAKILGNQKWALVPAFLMAISPWGVLTSRQVLQATPAVFLYSLGVWFWLSKVRGNWVWGTIFLGLSAYAYHNTRILAPITLVVLLIYNWASIKRLKNKLVVILVLALVFFGPVIYSLVSGSASARATWVGILDQGAINRINVSRGASSLPGPLPKLVNNKYTYFVSTSLVNYWGYFSPVFLAWEGGTQYQFSVPHFGLIYPMELGFFYLGLLVLIGFGLKHWRQIRRLDFGFDVNHWWIFLVIVLISPLPAAITRDPYQVVRGLILMPFVYCLTGLGFFIFCRFLIKRVSNWSAIGLGLVSLSLVLGMSFFYFQNLFFEYPKYYSFAWQYGYRQAINFINQNYQKYDQIVMTKKYGEPHEFVLFFNQYDPQKLRTDPKLKRYLQSNWYWVDSFDKYQFVNDWQIKEKMALAKNTLLITSPGNYPVNGRKLGQINFLDGNPAFDLVELN